jgi:magnesium protoporphyrin O-methyltransferase
MRAFGLLSLCVLFACGGAQAVQAEKLADKAVSVSIEDYPVSAPGKAPGVSPQTKALALSLGAGINFGDMLDAQFGIFDHVVAMDSLIHYRPEDMVQSLSSLAPRIRRSMLMTFAPKTPLLAAMHFVGRAFPRGDRAPAIEPVAERSLKTRIKGERQLMSWSIGQDRRISRGFYTSHALELIRK